mgnify:CR=1 FL=1
MPRTTKTDEDLLLQIVELKKQLANLQNFADTIRPYFHIWNCDSCGQIKRFKNEIPVKRVMCELCELEMRPYAIAQYRELKQQYDDLDLLHSTAIAERNKYANIVQVLIPLLGEYGYNKEENDLISFLKTQFEYQKMLEEKLISLPKME